MDYANYQDVELTALAASLEEERDEVRAQLRAVRAEQQRRLDVTNAARLLAGLSPGAQRIVAESIASGTAFGQIGGA